MEITFLKEQLRSLFPSLVANRDRAFESVRNGVLEQQAFEQVQFRLDTAHAVMQRTDITAEQGFKACAVITLDVRAAVSAGSADQAKLDSWIDCFRAAGYTEMHPLFAVPVTPETGTVLL